MWWLVACAPDPLIIEDRPYGWAPPSESWEAGPEVACADPSARATAPLYEADAGEDWAAQFAGDLDRPAGWGMAVADFDGDARLDLFLPQPYQDELYLGQADGTLALGDFPDEDGDGLGAAAADYDGDGDFDLYVTNQGWDRLWRNDAGEFVDVTVEAGLPEEPWRGMGAAWGDADGDLDLDLLVANNFARDQHPDEPGDDGLWEADPNLLFLNDGDGTFTAVEDAFDARSGRGFTYMAGFVDADVDGDLDVYVVNDKGADSHPNALVLNDGAGGFAFDGGASFTDWAMDGMGLGVGDLDDDLVPDLIVPGRGLFRLGVSVGDGTWAESAPSLGVTYTDEGGRVLGWGTEMADLDNDGDLDVIAAFGVDDLTPGTDPDDPLVENAPIEEPDALFVQGDDGRFLQVAEDWGIATPAASRGIVVTDWNGDGVLDYLRRQVYGPSRIFVSNCGDAHWVELRLVQDAPNVHAIGARVVLEAGGRRRVRWISSGSTSLSSSGPPRAHVGLGDATAIDSVEITWPDGHVQRLADLPVDRVVTVLRE
ncbi:MAG: CRTAC1 family protein [Myxococcota bacterium]